MTIYGLPRKLFVIIAILGGVLFIVFQNPPKTLCDTQKEVFIKEHQDFLFKNPKNKVRTETILKENIKECKKSNTPGGCYSLFYRIPKIIQSFRALKPECRAAAAALKEVKEGLLEIYALFLEISWGEGPSGELSNPLSWLSSNDVSLFCALKNQITSLFGPRVLDEWNRKTFEKLAPDHSQTQHRRFSILSENCFRHP